MQASCSCCSLLACIMAWALPGTLCKLACMPCTLRSTSTVRSTKLRLSTAAAHRGARLFGHAYDNTRMVSSGTGTHLCLHCRG